MPTIQPSNAPDSIGADAKDDLTAGAVMADEDMDDAPGGGGLGGAAASRGAERDHPGTAPNAPIDTHTAGDPSGRAAREAQEADATTEPPSESL